MLGIALGVVFLLLVWAICLWAQVSLWIPIGVTVGVVVIAAGGILWKRLRAGKAARNIERSLGDQADAYAERARPDLRVEAQTLQSEFDRALSALKGSKLGSGGAGALYALPWYVIVGPPGVGKSTALRNSGLKFPALSKGGGVRGVGGTRNCDWWLSNEAVILDTAGRYATRDDDKAEWLEFLRILTRARPKEPINGILLALSVTEVAALGESEREQLARQMRERLDEMVEELGAVAPIYVLFTKCDLIPGFVETFEDLRRGEREQVWGLTLTADEAGADLADRMRHHLEPLVQVLERRCIQRASEQRTVEAREGALGFPEQFESLVPGLSAFIASVFSQNVYKDSPLLRGVYFTSGTQEGSPVDRVMQSMVSGFGLEGEAQVPARATEAKSYFLGELFRSVLFPDRGLTRRSRNQVRKGLIAQLGVAAVLVGLALSASFAGLASYSGNVAVVGRARASLRAVEERKQSAEPIPLRSLDPLNDVLGELSSHQADGVPLRLGFGLYQGGALLPVVERSYTRALRDGVVGAVHRDSSAQIERHVRAARALDAAPGVRDHAAVYDLLKAYLLLSAPKEPAEPGLSGPLRDWLLEVLVEHWAERGDAAPPPPAERTRMAAHLKAYLSLASADASLLFARDEQLVREARAFLGRLPAERLAVDRLVAEIEPLGWDLTLDGVLGSGSMPLKGVGRVQGAFTRRAWEAHLRELFENDPEELLGQTWVLSGAPKGADEVDSTARGCALRSHYLERYLAQWKQFIGSLRMEEPSDNARSLVVLQDLTRGAPPPLVRLMRVVGYNARLEPKPEPKQIEEAKQKAEGVLAKIREAVADTPAAGLLGSRDACAGSDYLKPDDVRRALQGFYGFGVTESDEAAAEAGGGAAQYTAAEVYQEQLMFVRDALVALIDDPTRSDALLERLSAARTRVRGLIDSQEVGFRPRFDALLWPPINGAFASSAQQLAGERGSRWCTSVVQPFRKSLLERYPFSRTGQDAALSDLVEFYHPDSGVIWSFYDAILARDVPRVGSQFQTRGGHGVSELYNAELLAFLGRSQRISDVLFPRRAAEPRVDFEVRIRPSPGIASVVLTIDGQEIDFHNGPEKWVPVTWPGGGDASGATMRVKGADVDEVLQQEGPWGWFRLLDRSMVSAIPNQRFFTARFRLRTQNDVVVDVRPARADNPFVGERKFMEAFRAEGVRVPEQISAASAACPE